MRSRRPAFLLFSSFSHLSRVRGFRDSNAKRNERGGFPRFPFHQTIQRRHMRRSGSKRYCNFATHKTLDSRYNNQQCSAFHDSEKIGELPKNNQTPKVNKNICDSFPRVIKIQIYETS